MILLCNQQSFICTHVDFCHPRCYQYHSRSCARLVRAIKLLYGEAVDGPAGSTGPRAKKTKEVGAPGMSWAPGTRPDARSWDAHVCTCTVLLP